MSNIKTVMVTGVTVPRSLIFFNQTFQTLCLYYSTFTNDAEKGIAMYVCRIIVQPFDLFINDIIIMMNKVYQK